MSASAAPELIVEQLEVGPMANYAYLLADPISRECALVDPGWEPAVLLDAVRSKRLKLSSILVTHHHFDHTRAIPDVLAAFDVPVYVHKNDAAELKGLGKSLRLVDGGHKARVGGVDVEFLHTPGHTKGSQCFLARGRLLTGDTLFLNGCGRMDLPGGDPEEMYASLRRLAALGSATWVMPGHNYSPGGKATLESQRDENPYVRASLDMSPAEFRRLVGF